MLFSNSPLLSCELITAGRLPSCAFVYERPRMNTNAHERTLIDAAANVRFVAYAKPKIARVHDRARSRTFRRFLALSCVFVLVCARSCAFVRVRARSYAFVRVRACSCAIVRDHVRSCAFVHVRDTCPPNCTIYYTYSKLFYFCPIATFIAQ